MRIFVGIWQQWCDLHALPSYFVFWEVNFIFIYFLFFFVCGLMFWCL